jgi:hypothetical protein
LSGSGSFAGPPEFSADITLFLKKMDFEQLNPSRKWGEIRRIPRSYLTAEFRLIDTCGSFSLPQCPKNR